MLVALSLPTEGTMNKLSTPPGIRFIVTSLCNYDCSYCHNEWEPKEREVTDTERELIMELITATKELGGVEVDLTGGEPLLRPEKTNTIVRTATDLNLWTSLTTNGFFLGELMKDLRDSGLKEIHVHIPSLYEERYTSLMKGNSDLPRVLKGLERSVEVFDTVKANIPIIPGGNEEEIESFIEYFNGIGVVPRFIESMPTIDFKRRRFEFDKLLVEKTNGAKLEGSYLWGINEYSSERGTFETLRCICFDRKCDVCPETNFIHVDQNYNIRPCNLRSYRFPAKEGKVPENLMRAIRFLEKQTDVPTPYKRIWEKD